MDNQTFIIASIILCSLGGWYVVITKYLALKKMVKEHIPGMGPPPVVDFMDTHHYAPATQQPSLAATRKEPSAAVSTTATDLEKRLACNLACMLHICGFALVFGVPFLNVIVPLLFWLWHKERHPFLDKQGREVVNFQITYTILQFLCLGAGVLFIRYLPEHAEKLFTFAKITRVVFSSGLHLPFNMFTMVPFIWCCVVMIRGAVAAYNGVNFKYPMTQQFIFTPKANNTRHAATQPATADATNIQSNVNFS